MTIVCNAVGCKSQMGLLTVNGKKISYLRFPKNEGLTLNWVRNMRKGEWLQSNSSKLCSLDFVSACYQDGFQRKVSHSYAVPTIFTNQISNTEIYYLDSHDIISWVLHRTNPEIDGRETILQCAQSTHSTDHTDKPNSCFSAAAIFLKAGDRRAVRNTGGDRHSLMQPEKSFIGLVKLHGVEDPNQEL